MKTQNISSAGKRISRRQFLGGALAGVGAVLTMPEIIPSGVLAANGAPGANEKIGVGFIGIGRQASDLLRNMLTQAGARFVGVADVNLNRAKEVAAKHNVFACQDFRRLLERKDVDAIITATPEHWRGPICILSCQAGKDIYVEKPVSLTIREGRLIVQAARKYNRVVQVGSQQRSMWINKAACELIRTGALGKVKKVICMNYPSPWECALPAEPIPDGLDWDMWCGPNPVVPYNKDLYLPRANPGWLSFRPYSGGEMTGWGSHGFDQVQWALGMDESGPIEIWTSGEKFDPPTYTQPESKQRGDKICSVPKVFWKYPGDIVMEMGDAPGFGAVFVCEKGTLRIDRGRCSSDPEDIAIELIKKRPRGYNDNHIFNWLECIKTRSKPNADVEIGHRSATVCHLGNIARWAGRRLKWDPVKETFPEDADACKYLDRERRKPWQLPEKI
jgi:predicted dehydrogenase